MSSAGLAISSSNGAHHHAAGAIVRRAMPASSAIAASKVSSGTTVAATVSAAPAPISGASGRMIAASGRSTSRLQWMSAPAGGSSRYCLRSNQPCPPIQSRTCNSRSASSLSGSVIVAIACARETSSHAHAASHSPIRPIHQREPAGDGTATAPRAASSSDRSCRTRVSFPRVVARRQSKGG